MISTLRSIRERLPLLSRLIFRWLILPTMALPFLHGLRALAWDPLKKDTAQEDESNVGTPSEATQPATSSYERSPYIHGPDDPDHYHAGDEDYRVYDIPFVDGSRHIRGLLLWRRNHKCGVVIYINNLGQVQTESDYDASANHRKGQALGYVPEREIEAFHHIVNSIPVPDMPEFTPVNDVFWAWKSEVLKSAVTAKCFIRGP